MKFVHFHVWFLNKDLLKATEKASMQSFKMKQLQAQVKISHCLHFKLSFVLGCITVLRVSL